VIVSDTTPLNYLILIEAVQVLPALYKGVLIPRTVQYELSHAAAPDVVRAWIANPPDWLRVELVESPALPALSGLDPGEREAILLAKKHPDGLLLIDERDGVTAALRDGLKVLGTLGVLDAAASRGLIDLRTIFDRLDRTSFRSPRRLIAAMLAEDEVRRKKSPG
jgi:predicted nucleic acid-binding protein